MKHYQPLRVAKPELSIYSDEFKASETVAPHDEFFLRFEFPILPMELVLIIYIFRYFKGQTKEGKKKQLDEEDEQIGEMDDDEIDNALMNFNAGEGDDIDLDGEDEDEGALPDDDSDGG